MKRFTIATAMTTALGMAVLSGCAGSVGQAEADGSAGEGVEYGASKAEYQEALADMDPVELVYQGGSTGTGHTADRERAFAKSIEEWSGGKISVEVIFGQSIAPYDEVVEAVADGRIDLGMEIPIYNPAKYPAITDLSALSAAPAPGPLLPEMVHIAAGQEVAWDTAPVLDDVRDKGVEVLVPAEFEFSNSLICSEPVTSLKDFKGKQIRAGSATDFALAEALGASGVSLQLGEVYDALQRHVIDCAIISLKIAASQGLLEVAPEVTFPTDVSWGRSSTALVAGAKVSQLPLAARQLIWDMLEGYVRDHISSTAAWTVDATDAVHQFGGGFHRIDPAAEEKLQEVIDGLREPGALNVLDPQATGEDLDAAIEKWTGIAEDEGYRDYADWNEMAAELGDEPLDVDAYAKRMYEEIYLPHRPS
ncbi:hypothetical protein [Nocardioides insulae]|uniref:hypothetical protein n=1 Tax=Nocardioides insulae TaxID=394734 RepID=UPI000688ECF0|nr:hypothetical protein [Nocardioides insulae]